MTDQPQRPRVVAWCTILLEDEKVHEWEVRYSDGTMAIVTTQPAIGELKP